MTIFSTYLKIKKMKRVMLALLVLTSLSVFSQKSVLLKMNYKKGDTYELNMEFSQGLGIMGGFNMNGTMKMNVVGTTNTEITTETRIKEMKVNVLQGGSTMSFDSNTKEEDLDATGKQMKAQFDPMMKALITQVSNRQGKIISSKVEPQIPGMDNFGQQFEYPTTAVSVGSTWSSETSDPESGTTKMTYKVEKITATTVFASITGDVSALPGSTIKGSMEIDIATGNVNTSEVLISADAQGNKLTINTKLTSTKI